MIKEGMAQREYKDSGIEWIGRIPREWKTSRFKALGYIYGGLVGKSGNDFDVEEKDNYSFYIPFTNIFNNDVIDTNNLNKVKCIEGETQNEVHKDDLLFLMSSEDFEGIGKPAILQTSIPSLYLNSFCKGFRITSTIVYPKFLFYIMSSHFVREQLRIEAKGFIRINLRQDKLSCCNIFLPPLTEQMRIADYLDKKCIVIDELVELQVQMMAQLTDYKQSVITEAVTKGLNPYAELVPSGIDWIGDVPKGWKTTKISNLAKTNSGSTPKCIINDSNSKIIWVRTVDINEDEVITSSNKLTENEFINASCPMLEPGTCVVAMYGGAGTIGKSGILKVKATINQALCSMETRGNCFNYYLFYVLRALRPHWMKYAVGTRKDPNINQEIVKRMSIPLPPLSEQQAIASYLDSKCSEIDSLIAVKRKKIETLKEYKKSVIYEAVTGKTIID